MFILVIREVRKIFFDISSERSNKASFSCFRQKMGLGVESYQKSEKGEREFPREISGKRKRKIFGKMKGA